MPMANRNRVDTRYNGYFLSWVCCLAIARLFAALATPLAPDRSMTTIDGLGGGGQHQHWHSSLYFDLY
jgi:hypothetical protein